MKTITKQLLGVVVKAAPNLKGFDTNTIVTKEQAENFKKDGYSFCIRYLSLKSEQGTNDLSFEEAQNILSGGLSLSAVQHVRYEGWNPDSELGTTYGQNAANNALSIGLPKGMNIWCDLEGVNTDSTTKNIIDYCNSWYDAVNSAGYVPGLYVGANTLLNGTELYNDLKFSHYWKSLSNVPSIPKRGYQLIQSLEKNRINGLDIDNDTTQNDDLGDSMLFLSPIKQKLT